MAPKKVSIDTVEPINSVHYRQKHNACEQFSEDDYNSECYDSCGYFGGYCEDKKCVCYEDFDNDFFFKI